jgi:2-methylisocitrate lyase-like PEP mutase family enzyme
VSASAMLRNRLLAGDKLVSMGAWDVLSAKVIERAGFDMVALQSFQWAAGWGLPDIAITTPSDLATLTFRMAGEIETPILVDFEEGYGSPGHASYWVREFERAGAAALHVDDKGPVHMCPWLPGSEVRIEVSSAEYTAEIISAMASARRDDVLIIARTQVKSDGLSTAEEEQVRRLTMYIEAGADVVYAPKYATMSNDLTKLKSFAERVPVPVLAQFNPPGFIEGYIPEGSKDGRSIADRSFEEIFDCGVQIINTPQIYAVAYRALGETLGMIREEGSLQPARSKMLKFQEVLDLLGYERFQKQ